MASYRVFRYCYGAQKICLVEQDGQFIRVTHTEFTEVAMAQMNRGDKKLEGNTSEIPNARWAEVRANVRKHFSQLTNDDLKMIDQNNGRLVDVLHDRYGFNHNQAQQEWERFMQTYAAGMNPSNRDQNVGDELINDESAGSATSQVNGPQHKDDLVGQSKRSR